MNITDSEASAKQLDEEAQGWLNRLRSSRSLNDQAAFEAWFCASPAHAHAYEVALDRWDQMGRVAETEIGLSRRRFVAAPAVGHRKRYAVLTAAAAAIVIILAFGANIPPGPFDRSFVPVAYASGVGEIRTVTLSDGTRVTLDTDTAVKVMFSAKQRQLLLLRGRARFEVARDPARRFVVVTNRVSVTSGGSTIVEPTFDLSARTNSTEVALLRGEIVIGGRSAIADAAPARLRAGNRLSLGPDKSDFAAQPFPKSEQRWVGGMLSFEDAPLGDVLVASNRYSVAQISVTDNEIDQLRFTGTFRPTETKTLAQMLGVTFGLKVTRDPHGDYLLSIAQAPHTRHNILPG